MNQDIQKLEEEKQRLITEIEELDKTKNQKFTRIVELQGIIKWLKEKEAK